MQANCPSNTSASRPTNPQSRVSTLSNMESVKSIFNMDKLSFDIAIEIFIRKQKILTTEISCREFDINDTIMNFRAQLAVQSTDYNKITQDIRSPSFSGEFTIRQSNKKFYSLSIRTQSQYIKACRKWWDIQHAQKGNRKVTRELSASLALVYSIIEKPTRRQSN